MSFGSGAVQRVFFPGMKVRPKSNWHEATNTLGAVERWSIPRKNQKVSAVIVTPKDLSGEPKTIAILAHPISKKAKYFPLESGRAKEYLERGVPVVAFDFNGFGESDRIDLFYWRDAAAVIEAVKNRFPGARIILHGMSFGAFHIVRAVPTLPANSTVVLENVSRSLYDYWKRWFLTRNAVRVLQTLRLPSIRDMEIHSVLSNLKRPDLEVHFIACENDAFTPANEMQDLFAATDAKKNFHSLPGLEHLAAPQKAAARYSEIISTSIKA